MIKKEWIMSFSLFLPVFAVLLPPVILGVLAVFVVVFTIVHWGVQRGILSVLLFSFFFLLLLFLPQHYFFILGIISASLGFVLLGLFLGREMDASFPVIPLLKKKRTDTEEEGLTNYSKGTNSFQSEVNEQQKPVNGYHMVTEEIPLLICRFSPDYTITYVNRSYCQFFKKTAKELMGTSFLAQIHTQEKETVVARLSLLTPKRPTRSLELKVQRVDGEICWQRWIYRGLFDEAGDMVAYHSFGEDITAQKQAEEQIVERENKYRILFEGSHDAIVIMNKKGRFLDCNKRTVQLFGLQKKGDLFAKPPAAFFPTHQPHGQTSDEALHTYIERVLLTDKPIRFEWIYRRMNGDSFPAEVILTSYQLQGEMVLYANIRDISHHKRAEETLQKSEEKYRMLSENASDIIWTLDMDLSYTYVSPSAERLTGYTVDEILSLSIDEVLTPSSYDLAMRSFQEELLNEYSNQSDPDRTKTLELEQLCKDGSRVMVEMKMRFLRDGQGRPTGIFGITRDITHRKEAERQIAEKNALLSLLNSIALEQAGVHHYDGLMDMILIQFQKSTGALLVAFSEYNAHRNVLLTRKIKTEQGLEDMIATDEKKIINTETSIGDAVYQEILSCIVFSSETGTEVTKGAIPVFISRIIQEEWGIDRYIGLGHVAEGQLYGVSIIGLGDGQTDPSLEFLESFAHITAISLRRLQAERKLVAYTKEMEALYHQLDEEMDKARQVHERLLPKSLPMVEGLSVAAHYQPAKKLGGDCYDMIKVGNKLVLYLSDVSGHGLDGCMLSLFVKHTVKSYLTFSPKAQITPGNILHYLALQFNGEDYPHEYFICLFLAVLDLETLEMTYSGVGFQDTPYVRMGSGERVRLYTKGLFISNNYPVDLIDFTEDRILLNPGSTIFFNTDGLTEEGRPGAIYQNRLPEVFYRNAHQSPQHIARSVLEDFQHFNKGVLQGKDDITFIVLQVDKEWDTGA